MIDNLTPDTVMVAVAMVVRTIRAPPGPARIRAGPSPPSDPGDPGHQGHLPAEAIVAVEAALDNGGHLGGINAA